MWLNLSYFHAECKDSKTFPFSPIFSQNFPQKVINSPCGYLRAVFGAFREISTDYSEILINFAYSGGVYAGGEE
jgi:hypothetical protein